MNIRKFIGNVCLLSCCDEFGFVRKICVGVWLGGGMNLMGRMVLVFLCFLGLNLGEFVVLY